MAGLVFNTKWIWHPDWAEDPLSSSAGGFVDFRKVFSVDQVPADPVAIHISADTRYKLYLNSTFVHAGPVKGDEQLWFFDKIDLQPYLRSGRNIISIRVLRFYYASRFAASFPRTQTPGLYIEHVPSEELSVQSLNVQTDETWEAALNHFTQLPNTIKDDDFLHTYEATDQRMRPSPEWKPAVPHKFLTSFGLQLPWKLSPRLIPYPRLERTWMQRVHKVESAVAREVWERALLGDARVESRFEVLLRAASSHYVELETEYTTGYLEFRFLRPKASGSKLQVTYSECFEDEPHQRPYSRAKGDRTDPSKLLIGPSDSYVFGGPISPSAALSYHEAEEYEEVYAPFHFRTFRFLSLDIDVADTSDLVLLGISITQTNYPLEVVAQVDVPEEDSWVQDLWSVSLRTLKSCMHDCYEDCPFYEQLQYAMDTRSSSLFTYCVSGDDRLAKQAIIQLHNSFQSAIGLTASRAPSHHLQIIPNFSLYWACMLTDHYEYFKDADFVRQFLPVAHAILETFHNRIDHSLGLVRSVKEQSQWDFVDWTGAWKPFGIPPASQRTGFTTVTNALYAYTLQRLASLLASLGRNAMSEEYLGRAEIITQAISAHCFDGSFFTDGLAAQADSSDYSQHSQVWAILCGAASARLGAKVLLGSLQKSSEPDLSHKIFTQTSTAMSFYTLRALSLLGDALYASTFHSFWDPWRAQLAQNLTTWVEDDVNQRSDCHAWGSLPLFEIVTEVAGVRPALPGWGTISFTPRLSLFRTFAACIPVSRHLGGKVHVKWDTNVVSRSIAVSLSSEAGCEKVLVHVALPNGRKEIGYLPGTLSFNVPLTESDG